MIQLINDNLDDIEDVPVIEKCFLIKSNALEKNASIKIKQKRVTDMLLKNKETQQVLNKQLHDNLKILKKYK